MYLLKFEILCHLFLCKLLSEVIVGVLLKQWMWRKLCAFHGLAGKIFATAFPLLLVAQLCINFLAFIEKKEKVESSSLSHTDYYIKITPNPKPMHYCHFGFEGSWNKMQVWTTPCLRLLIQKQKLDWEDCSIKWIEYAWLISMLFLFMSSYARALRSVIYLKLPGNTQLC